MNSKVLRKRFLAFFEKNAHKIETSSSIIPAQDPTILFANAGMNQFKDLFLGNEKRSYDKATTSQKCVRAGGKHNDLDNVGFTDRHLTFFEMLGNFSFGSYFKEEAISFAWTFLTEEIGIDASKLSVTVHYSDDESFDIWNKKIGLPSEKITRLGDEDNFWQMGDTGPCGPCTEIFYDRGVEWDSKIIYGATATRFLEIWNLVFMQYNQQENGQRTLLDRTGVDTGMGLERLAMVLSGGDTVYDSDLFLPIIKFLEDKSGINYKNSNYEIQASFNVVADHIRSSCMIITDGGRPANDGRGYVLRKIIRRALLFLKKLTQDPFVFSELAEVVANFFAEEYPEVLKNLELTRGILSLEIDRFSGNLQRGQKYFEGFLKEAKKECRLVLAGEEAFKLYDTYGFPLEVTHVLAKENNLEVDVDGFEREMQKQKEQSSGKKTGKISFELPKDLSSEFVGYKTTTSKSIILWTDVKDGCVWVAVSQTPFFAACGGQVTDTGSIFFENKKHEFDVLAVMSIPNGENKKAILMSLSIEAEVLAKVGSEVLLVVNPEVRANTAKNHTATHLLQAALQEVFGKSVQQSASLVHPDYLRFGFTLNKSMSSVEIYEVEQKLNSWVCQNFEVLELNTTLEEADKMGAMALFGEKYNPETVRVINIGGFSVELCGGTHVARTGDIGAFKIVSEDSMGMGVRCIIAQTGPAAVKLFSEEHNILVELGQKFACKPDSILELVSKQFGQIKTLEQDLKKVKQSLLETSLGSFEEKVKVGSSFEMLELCLENLDQDTQKFFRQKVASDRNRLCFLISKAASGNISFVILLGRELSNKLDVSIIISSLREIGIKAGGKKDFACGSCLEQDLEKVRALLLGLSQEK